MTPIVVPFITSMAHIGTTSGLEGLGFKGGLQAVVGQVSDEHRFLLGNSLGTIQNHTRRPLRFRSLDYSSYGYVQTWQLRLYILPTNPSVS